MLGLKSTVHRSKRSKTSNIDAKPKSIADLSQKQRDQLLAGEKIPDDLVCMVEGCDQPGEEVIALLENSDVDARGKVSRDSELSSSDSETIIPAIVCSRHYNKLLSSWSPIPDNLKRSVTE